eukprot:gene25946-32456_t
MNSTSFNSNYDNQGNRITKKASNNVMSLTMDALALHNDIIETKKQVHDPELEAVLRMSEQDTGRRGGGMQPQKDYDEPSRYEEPIYDERDFESPRARRNSLDYDERAYDERYEEGGRGERQRGEKTGSSSMARAKSMHVPASFTNSLNKHLSPQKSPKPSQEADTSFETELEEAIRRSKDEAQLAAAIAAIEERNLIASLSTVSMQQQTQSQSHSRTTTTNITSSGNKISPHHGNHHTSSKDTSVKTVYKQESSSANKEVSPKPDLKTAYDLELEEALRLSLLQDEEDAMRQMAYAHKLKHSSSPSQDYPPPPSQPVEYSPKEASHLINRFNNSPSVTMRTLSSPSNVPLPLMGSSPSHSFLFSHSHSQSHSQSNSNVKISNSSPSLSANKTYSSSSSQQQDTQYSRSKSMRLSESPPVSTSQGGQQGQTPPGVDPVIASKQAAIYKQTIERRQSLSGAISSPGPPQLEAPSLSPKLDTSSKSSTFSRQPSGLNSASSADYHTQYNQSGDAYSRQNGSSPRPMERSSSTSSHQLVQSPPPPSQQSQQQGQGQQYLNINTVSPAHDHPPPRQQMNRQASEAHSLQYSPQAASSPAMSINSGLRTFDKNTSLMPQDAYPFSSSPQRQTSFQTNSSSGGHRSLDEHSHYSPDQVSPAHHATGGQTFFGPPGGGSLQQHQQHSGSAFTDPPGDYSRQNSGDKSRSSMSFHNNTSSSSGHHQQNQNHDEHSLHSSRTSSQQHMAGDGQYEGSERDGGRDRLSVSVSQTTRPQSMASAASHQSLGHAQQPQYHQDSSVPVTRRASLPPQLPSHQLQHNEPLRIVTPASNFERKPSDESDMQSYTAASHSGQNTYSVNNASQGQNTFNSAIAQNGYSAPVSNIDSGSSTARSPRASQNRLNISPPSQLIQQQSQSQQQSQQEATMQSAVTLLTQAMGSQTSGAGPNNGTQGQGGVSKDVALQAAVDLIREAMATMNNNNNNANNNNNGENKPSTAAEGNTGGQSSPETVYHDNALAAAMALLNNLSYGQQSSQPQTGTSTPTITTCGARSVPPAAAAGLTVSINHSNSSDYQLPNNNNNNNHTHNTPSAYSSSGLRTPQAVLNSNTNINTYRSRSPNHISRDSGDVSQYLASNPNNNKVATTGRLYTPRCPSPHLQQAAGQDSRQGPSVPLSHSSGSNSAPHHHQHTSSFSINTSSSSLHPGGGVASRDALGSFSSDFDGYGQAVASNNNTIQTPAHGTHTPSSQQQYSHPQLQSLMTQAPPPTQSTNTLHVNPDNGGSLRFRTASRDYSEAGSNGGGSTNDLRNSSSGGGGGGHHERQPNEMLRRRNVSAVAAEQYYELPPQDAVPTRNNTHNTPNNSAAAGGGAGGHNRNLSFSSSQQTPQQSVSPRGYVNNTNNSNTNPQYLQLSSSSLSVSSTGGNTPNNNNNNNNNNSVGGGNVVSPPPAASSQSFYLQGALSPPKSNLDRRRSNSLHAYATTGGMSGSIDECDLSNNNSNNNRGSAERGGALHSNSNAFQRERSEEFGVSSSDLMQSSDDSGGGGGGGQLYGDPVLSFSGSNCPSPAQFSHKSVSASNNGSQNTATRRHSTTDISGAQMRAVHMVRSSGGGGGGAHMVRSSGGGRGGSGGGSRDKLDSFDSGGGGGGGGGGEIAVSPPSNATSNVNRVTENIERKNSHGQMSALLPSNMVGLSVLTVNNNNENNNNSAQRSTPMNGGGGGRQRSSSVSSPGGTPTNYELMNNSNNQHNQQQGNNQAATNSHHSYPPPSQANSQTQSAVSYTSSNISTPHFSSTTSTPHTYSTTSNHSSVNSTPMNMNNNNSYLHPPQQHGQGGVQGGVDGVSYAHNSNTSNTPQYSTQYTPKSLSRPHSATGARVPANTIYNNPNYAAQQQQQNNNITNSTNAHPAVHNIADDNRQVYDPSHGQYAGQPHHSTQSQPQPQAHSSDMHNRYHHNTSSERMIGSAPANGRDPPAVGVPTREVIHRMNSGSEAGSVHSGNHEHHNQQPPPQQQLYHGHSTQHSMPTPQHAFTGGGSGSRAAPYTPHNNTSSVGGGSVASGGQQHHHQEGSQPQYGHYTNNQQQQQQTPAPTPTHAQQQGLNRSSSAVSAVTYNNNLSTTAGSGGGGVSRPGYRTPSSSSSQQAPAGSGPTQLLQQQHSQSMTMSGSNHTPSSSHNNNNNLITTPGSAHSSGSTNGMRLGSIAPRTSSVGGGGGHSRQSSDSPANSSQVQSMLVEA